VSVDRLKTFLEPDETRSLRRVGATAAVVDDRDDGRVADHVARDPDALASACLMTFVTDSAMT
jgi:hypothetical protein